MPTGLTPGSARRLKQIEKLTEATMLGIRHANYLIGVHLTKLARTKILKPPKTGRIYHWRFPPESRTGPFRRHRASAIGESPANFTGRLKDSVSFLVKGQQLHFGAGGPVMAGRWKGFEVSYARILELGGTTAGPGKARIGKRPYLKPAITESTKVVLNYYKQYIGQNVKATITKEGMSIKVK